MPPSSDGAGSPPCDGPVPESGGHSPPANAASPPPAPPAGPAPSPDAAPPPLLRSVSTSGVRESSHGPSMFTPRSASVVYDLSTTMHDPLPLAAAMSAPVTPRAYSFVTPLGTPVPSTCGSRRPRSPSPPDYGCAQHASPYPTPRTPPSLSRPAQSPSPMTPPAAVPPPPPALSPRAASAGAALAAGFGALRVLSPSTPTARSRTRSRSPPPPRAAGVDSVAVQLLRQGVASPAGDPRRGEPLYGPGGTQLYLSGSGTRGEQALWVQCASCGDWWHVACTDYTGDAEFRCGKCCGAAPLSPKRARIDELAPTPCASPCASTGAAAAAPASAPPPPGRIFCPVPGCPAGDSSCAEGWASHRTMESHLRMHCCGTLPGLPPPAYLAAHKLCTCRQCGVLLHARHNGACPSCRPTLRATERPRDAAPTEPLAVGAPLPPLDEVFTRNVRTCKYVPKAARAAWCECLSTTVASAVWHNTDPAWTELAMLAKAVLCAAPRGGKGHRDKLGTFTRLRCQRWLAGERQSLWDDIPPRARGSAAAQRRSADDARRWRQQRAMEQWTYGAPSHLVFAGDEVLTSEADGQQGDPLAPLAFSLALNEILPGVAAAAAGGPGDLDQLFAYLDDGWIAGDDVAVARALRALLRLAPLHKCEVLPAAGVDTAVDRALCPQGILFPVPALAADLVAAFELLGAPVGPARFCADHTRGRVEAAQSLLDEIAQLPDPQISLRLLRNCASFGKLVYAARVVEYGSNLAELRDFDARVCGCFEGFTGLCPSVSQWDRAVLSVRNGGLGLRRVHEHAAAAYA
eukprot:gene10445-4870_t